MLTTIRNLKELKSERERLKLNLNISTQLIQEDIQELKKELNPAKLISGLGRSIMLNVVEKAIMTGIKSLEQSPSNKLFSIISSPFRSGISFLLRKAANNFLSRHRQHAELS